MTDSSTIRWRRFGKWLIIVPLLLVVVGCGAKKQEPTAAEKEQLRLQHLKDSQRERGAK